MTVLGDMRAASASWFEARTRDDGGAFVVLTDDAPESMRAAVYDVHSLSDSAPNDYVYELCAHVVDSLCYDAETVESFTDSDVWHTVADSVPSVYTYDRRQWFANYPDAPEYVHRAINTFGTTGDVVDMIGVAWFLAAYDACAVFGPVLAELAGEL